MTGTIVEQRKATLEKTREVTQHYISTQSSLGNKASALDEFLHQAKKAIENGNYVEAELCLDQHRDRQRDVTTTLITTDKDGNELATPVLLVDERAKKVDAPEHDTFENWAVMGLSYFQIAERMLEIESEKKIKSLQKQSDSQNLGKIDQQRIQAKIDQINQDLKAAQTELRHKAKIFLEKIKAESDKYLPDREKASKAAKGYMASVVTHYVAPFLAKQKSISEKDALKQMKALRDFGIMDTKPWATVTLTQHQNEEGQSVDAACTDLKIYELTEKQKAEFQNIANNNGEEPEWFKKHPPVVQDVIRHYAPYIAGDKDGNGRAIPTQLLQWIPGVLRNAEESYGDLYERNEANNLTRTEFYYETNSGNFGHEINGQELDQHADDQYIQEVINQVQAATGATHVYSNALVTRDPIRAWIMKKMGKKDESKLHDQVSGAIERKEDANVVHGNIAVNGGRRRESNIMTAANAIDKLAKELIAHAENNAANLDEESKRIIITLQQIREEFDDLRDGSTFTDPDNRNMQLVAKIKQMASLMRLYSERNSSLGFSNPVLFAFCKSGKDRAGETRGLAYAEALARALMPKVTGERLPEKFKEACQKAKAEPTLIQKALKTLAFLEPPYLRHYVLAPIYRYFFSQTPFEKTLSDVKKKVFSRIGRAASHQSRGNEGVKDKEHTTTDVVASDEHKERLLRDTANYNSKLPAPTVKAEVIQEHFGSSAQIAVGTGSSMQGLAGAANGGDTDSDLDDDDISQRETVVLVNGVGKRYNQLVATAEEYNATTTAPKPIELRST